MPTPLRPTPSRAALAAVPATTSWSLPRRYVVGVFAALATVIWGHGVAAILRHLGDVDAPLAAWPLTFGAVAVALALTVAMPRRGVAVAAASGLAAALGIERLAPGAGVAALALPLVGMAVAAAGVRLGDRLPAGIDCSLGRRRGLALAWALVGLLAVVQTGRLATWVTDPEQRFVVVTANPFWAGHQCLPAYLYGAELAARGEENLYHVHHYPAVDPEATPQTELAMSVEDPYQYPPQFLLLPMAALRLSEDVTTLRTVWFAAQVTLFVAAFVALALWTGGLQGRWALWMLPATLVAFPMTFNFQFGQFHLPSIALAVLGMLGLATGRRAVGGFLLATAILAKIFPAVLLAPLVAGRRWRDLGATCGWLAAITAVAFAVLGPAPFVAFFDYHLPRLGSGAAFAFDEAWPELAELVVADNQGVFGLARKLGLGKPAAATAGRLFGLAVLAAAWLAGRRLYDASRWSHGAAWLGLLGLASLTSPGAWGDYVPATAVWLLAYLVAVPVLHRRWRVPFAVAAAFQGLLLGTTPLGDWIPPMPVMYGVSAVGALLMLGLFAGAVARPAAWSLASKRPGDQGRAALVERTGLAAAS